MLGGEHMDRRLVVLGLFLAALVGALATAPHLKQEIGSSRGNSHPTGLDGISVAIYRSMHATLTVYVNGKPVYHADPDPLTKNIQYFINNIIAAPVALPAQLNPVDTNGARVNVERTSASTNAESQPSMIFYLSESDPPQDYETAYSLPTTFMSLGVSSITTIVANGEFVLTVTSTTEEASSSTTIKSLWVVTNIVDSGGTSHQFVVAVEPMNLTVSAGDNVTVTWSLHVPLEVSVKGRTVLTRNLAGLLSYYLTGYVDVILQDGSRKAGSGRVYAYTYGYYICALGTSLTQFSPAPGGVCKSYKLFYSQNKNLGFIYAIYYGSEITGAQTLSTKQNYQFYVGGGLNVYIYVVEITNVGGTCGEVCAAGITLPG